MKNILGRLFKKWMPSYTVCFNFHFSFFQATFDVFHSNDMSFSITSF